MWVFWTLPCWSLRFEQIEEEIQSFLKKSIPISTLVNGTVMSLHKEDNETNNRYVEIIKEHQQFLQNLKTEVKEI